MKRNRSPEFLLSLKKQSQLEELIQIMQSDAANKPHPLQGKYAALKIILFDKDHSISQVRADLVNAMVLMGSIIQSASAPKQASACLKHMEVLQVLIQLLSDMEDML